MFSVSRVLGKLWRDDCGAVLTTEYVLVSGVMVAGLVPALQSLRGRIVKATDSLGESVLAAVPPQPASLPQPYSGASSFLGYPAFSSSFAPSLVEQRPIVIVIQLDSQASTLPSTLLTPPSP